MVAILGYSKEQIRAAVVDMYTAVADAPESHFHFPVGERACRVASYPQDQLAAVPRSALASFAGVGCPFMAAVIEPGDVVLDVGSGSGTDALIAAGQVGESGKVWALDTTPAMRERLEDTLKKHGIANIEPLAGDAENIPLPDGCIDVVTSNGVLNLVPDKRRAIAEIFRVLRPGGRAQIADIVIGTPVTPDCENDPRLWAECVVGATVQESYLELFRDAGFENVEIVHDYDYFASCPSKETQQVARRFGARALVIRMRRGAAAPARLRQIVRRANPLRLARDLERRGLWGSIALGLAFLACYGTLAVVALLSALGVSLAVHEGAWAGTITLFALLATAIVAAGWKRHRSLLPLLPAVLGTAVIAYTMFASYSRTLEIGGFILLAFATLWDWRLRRAHPPPSRTPHRAPA